MTRRTKHLRAACLLMAVAAEAANATALDLSQIDLWVGEGTHAAGLAIDWDGDDRQADATLALAWGYRWDGTATVDDALRGVLAADPRLFAKLGTSDPRGTAVYGLGYDASGDGRFALDDQTLFDADGIAASGPSDGAAAVDPDDVYREGWLIAGFWHVGFAPANDTWRSASGGISSLVLDHGAWAGLTFTPTFSLAAFPNQLAPAPPPALPGDFTGDGLVDAADYTVWRDQQLGIEAYLAWRQHYAVATAIGQLAARANVPEPATALLLLVGLAAVVPRASRPSLIGKRAGSVSGRRKSTRQCVFALGANASGLPIG